MINTPNIYYINKNSFIGLYIVVDILENIFLTVFIKL